MVIVLRFPIENNITAYLSRIAHAQYPLLFFRLFLLISFAL